MLKRAMGWLAVVPLFIAGGVKAEAAEDWRIHTTIIEACSCPMFCQCYFNTSPAGHTHHGETEHFCKFNNAFMVNEGHFGETDLAGLKFWVTGDLGPDFGSGKAPWAIITVDEAATDEQKAAALHIIPKMYPLEWGSIEVNRGKIDWSADEKGAHALIDGGESAEVKLTMMKGNKEGEPIVIHNLPYFGVPANEGFIMMPNEVEAWRKGDKAFEYSGTNGFMISFELTSADVGA
jgi:hypothetical protein